MTKRLGACCALAAAVLLPGIAEAQFSQQAVLSGATGTETGYSVALSADGSTAILGAPKDNDWVGSATVFVRVNGAWVKQATLAAPDAIGGSNQGNGVALSADGNTAIVGGPVDDTFTGAAWVWTRSGQNWTEQAKLVGTGGIGWRDAGWSVSLSADGNTALVGAPLDDVDIGAAWVFVRSGGEWSQQIKLIGTGAIGAMPDQGFAVALAANGNSAIVGAMYDADDGAGNPVGAAWIFRRGSGGRWRQDVKLVADDPSFTWQGQAVALSGRGTRAIVGGLGRNGTAGGAWVYTRSPDGLWDRTAKLAGNGRQAYPFPAQGYSVSLSYTGHRALVAGWVSADGDQTAPGAGYLFSDASGKWRQASPALVGADSSLGDLGWSGALSADGRTVLLGGPGEVGGWVFGAPESSLARLYAPSP